MTGDHRRRAPGSRVADRGEGDPARRHPQGRGDFAFGSDLWAEGMLWGRDPALAAPVGAHRCDRRLGRDRDPRRAASLTADDVPGRPTTVSSIATSRSSPRLVRYRASRSPRSPPIIPTPPPAPAPRSSSSTSRSTPLVGPRKRRSTHAPDPSRRQPLPPPPHPARRSRTRPAPVVVEGVYEVGMQDQAFMGPEAGLADPRSRRRRGRALRFHAMAARRPRQVAACLGLPHDRCASRSRVSAVRSAPVRT